MLFSSNTFFVYGGHSFLLGGGGGHSKQFNVFEGSGRKYLKYLKANRPDPPVTL